MYFLNSLAVTRAENTQLFLMEPLYFLTVFFLLKSLLKLELPAPEERGKIDNELGPLLWKILLNAGFFILECY